jgi:hypothetical protein
MENCTMGEVFFSMQMKRSPFPNRNSTALHFAQRSDVSRSANSNRIFLGMIFPTELLASYGIKTIPME